jgi:hypothetical protein
MMPGTPIRSARYYPAHSVVVVTSRYQLRSLVIADGAQTVTLGRLTAAEALCLLGRALGAEQIQAEIAAGTRLVELCDGLPLALAIVAERSRRHGGLGQVVRALTDERARIEMLSGDDGAGDARADIRATLSWPSRVTSPEMAAMFRLPSCVPNTT